MDKINPLRYVRNTTPSTEPVMDASGWYETETTTKTVGISDTSGELAWMLAQGWVVINSQPLYQTVVTHEGNYSHYSQEHYLTRHTLQRRVLKPEKALNDLIRSTTRAYNEGRKVNDRRYDEILNIYNVVTDEMQDTLNAVEQRESTAEAFTNGIVSLMESDYNTYAATVDGMLDDYGDSQRTRINTKFNNELASARSGLIDRGMFNSTVWDSISVGIEREREIAITDFEDKMVLQQIASKDKLYQCKEEMRRQIMSAKDRMFDQYMKCRLSTEERRAQIVEAMMGFMERRNDTYPDIASIGNMATALGAGTPTSYTP